MTSAGATQPVQPILVMMVYRGGERFERALASLVGAERFFNRIVLSVTSEEDSDDMRTALRFAEDHPKTEVICTKTELPTMKHQAFWIQYLEATGAKPSDWIYWLAYDDQIRTRGIETLVDTKGNWPLKPGTAYFGPWALRHEQADHLWDGDPAADLESWTSFPAEGPLRLPVIAWIREQLRQPTYMQMSGSVCTLESHQRLIRSRPRKAGPMRIEMATAAAPCNTFVEEFSEPISIIYGRSNSDRANYAKTARKEDLHLAVWLGAYALAHPSAAPSLARIAGETATAYARALRKGGALPQEDWRVRGTVTP